MFLLPKSGAARASASINGRIEEATSRNRRYPEGKKQVNARAQKVYKMKIKVDKLIQKKNNQETK